MQHSVVQDYDTLTAFPEFMVEVTVFPREMQLHQSQFDSDEESNGYYLPDITEEYNDYFDEGD
jgi:hypothetical protein